MSREKSVNYENFGLGLGSAFIQYKGEKIKTIYDYNGWINAIDKIPSKKELCLMIAKFDNINWFVERKIAELLQFIKCKNDRQFRQLCEYNKKYYRHWYENHDKLVSQYLTECFQTPETFVESLLR